MAAEAPPRERRREGEGGSEEKGVGFKAESLRLARRPVMGVG